MARRETSFNNHRSNDLAHWVTNVSGKDPGDPKPKKAKAGTAQQEARLKINKNKLEHENRYKGKAYFRTNLWGRDQMKILLH